MKHARQRAAAKDAKNCMISIYEKDGTHIAMGPLEARVAHLGMIRDGWTPKGRVSAIAFVEKCANAGGLIGTPKIKGEPCRPCLVQET